MKKVVAVFLLICLFVPPAYAINIFEKLLYREDEIKLYRAKVLVAPLTHQICYMWCGNAKNGYWLALKGAARNQYQTVYNRENGY